MEHRLSFSPRPERAAIILAGGDGMRLRPLTRRLTGQDRPKQFCAFFGKRTLLEQTLERVSLMVPLSSTITVLNRAHRAFYVPLVKNMPARLTVEQPDPRGTAPAILYALLRLSDRKPRTVVAIVPSDHYVNDSQRFMGHVQEAIVAVEQHPEMTVLLGASPDSPRTGYGWICPGAALGGGPAGALSRVEKFVETPAPEQTESMLREGALWNTGIVVARLSTLIGSFMIAMPDLYVRFKKIRPTLDTVFEEDAVTRLYADLPNLNFSSTVLEKCPFNLGVIPVRGVEWNSLDSPRRVLRTFARLGVHPQWAAA